MEVRALQIGNSIITGVQKIEADLRNIVAAKNWCLVNFKEWRVGRIRTLEALLRFQDEFDKIHRYSNAGRTVGNGAALLGGAATVTGFCMSFSQALRPIGKELMDYGSTIGTIGGAATLATNIAECGFNMKVFNDVKAALQEDKFRTERLLGFFQRTKQLDTHLKEVFGCGVLMIGDVFKAFQELSVIQSEGGKALSNVQSYLSQLVANEFSAERLPQLDDEKLEKIFRNASYKLKQIFLEFCNNSEVRRVLRNISISFKKNPILFDLCKINIRLIAKVAVQNIAFVSSLASFGDKTLMHFVDFAAQGMFRIIIVALRICAFLAAVDAFKNRNSKHSKMVEVTRNFLREELETLEAYALTI